VYSSKTLLVILLLLLTGCGPIGQPSPTATPTVTAPAQTERVGAKVSLSRPTPTPRATCTVSAWALNVRAAPGVAHPVVDWLRRGDVVTITETTDGWGHTATGWINLTYCEWTETE